MKKNILLYLVLFGSLTCPLFAQHNRTPKVRPLRQDRPYDGAQNKDDGKGARINFGLSFSPTFNWMYTSTEGYARDGIIVGMRYGIPLNINLTRTKNYYVSTGIFIEHLGGKLSLHDRVVLPTIGETNNTEIHRTFRPTYLTLPLGILLKTNSIKNFYLCGQAGIFNSLLLQTMHTDACLLGEEMWSREKILYTKSATFKESGYAGIGIEYSVTPKMRAGLMANYVHTFTNFFKGAGQAYNSVLKVNPKAHIGYAELELHINFF